MSDTSAPSPDSQPGLAITWALSTISGYGIYGLQIAMQFLRRGGSKLILTHQPSVVVAPPLTQARLEPLLALARKIHGVMEQNPDELLSFRHAVLHGCSSDFAGFAGQERIRGTPNVGCAAIEHLACSDNGRAVAKNYDMFIAISRWNADYLKSLDVGPVHLCHQGIDASLFHPGPRTDLYNGRFVIFSGGKFEFRKGQDIVLAAFKIFRARHPDALLVTSWQNLLPPDTAAFVAAGHCDSVPEAATPYGLRTGEWLLQQGLPAESFIDLPFTHNLLMPAVLRECDVAIFPNRCEGGTNLVAMEAMACGVPTFVSYNTGHKDLVDLIGCGAFRDQKPVPQPAVMATTDGWGESSVEEIVAALESVYDRRQDAARDAAAVAARMADWQWGPLNEKLLQIVCA